MSRLRRFGTTFRAPLSSYRLPREKPKRHSLDSEPTLDLIVTRQHSFTYKRNLLSSSACDKCKLSIRYCVLFVKCDNCKLSFHEQCSHRLDMPCLPRLITPKRVNSSLKALRLGDYCPETSPMIPHLIVHCVMHLEKMSPDWNLYSTLGDDVKAARLLSEFKTRRNVPDLNQYDVETIAGCLMMFLMHIRDPLIMLSSHAEFFEVTNEDELLGSINSLSTTHRDTLIYLVIHWKRLSECNLNLSIELLSQHLGPIVFGTSRQSSVLDSASKMEMSRVSLQRILKLPLDTLRQMISYNRSSNSANSTSLTLSRNGFNSHKNKLMLTIKP